MHAKIGVAALDGEDRVDMGSVYDSRPIGKGIPTPPFLWSKTDLNPWAMPSPCPNRRVK